MNFSSLLNEVDLIGFVTILEIGSHSTCGITIEVYNNSYYKIVKETKKASEINEVYRKAEDFIVANKLSPHNGFGNLFCSPNELGSELTLSSSVKQIKKIIKLKCIVESSAIIEIQTDGIDDHIVNMGTQGQISSNKVRAIHRATSFMVDNGII